MGKKTLVKPIIKWGQILRSSNKNKWSNRKKRYIFVANLITTTNNRIEGQVSFTVFSELFIL